LPVSLCPSLTDDIHTTPYDLQGLSIHESSPNKTKLIKTKEQGCLSVCLDNGEGDLTEILRLASFANWDSSWSVRNARKKEGGRSGAPKQQQQQQQ
jgi:hypothetical protein